MTAETKIKIQDLSFEQDIEPVIPDTFYLCEVDYRAEFSDIDTIERALSDRSNHPIMDKISEYFDDNWEALDYAENEVRQEIADHFDLEDDEIDEIMEKFEDEIRDHIYGNDKSTPYSDLLRNTLNVPVKMSLYSNHDCINSHWLESQCGYSMDSYFGDAVNALNLNPAKVKKALTEKGHECTGRWPNKKNRDGKEFVTYSDFIGEDQERSCGGNLLCLLGTVDLSDIPGEFKKVTIPKGNPVGFYSIGQGGGSMFEATLLREMTIDLSKTGRTNYDHWGINTACNGQYDVKSCYGVDDTFFGNEVALHP